MASGLIDIQVRIPRLTRAWIMCARVAFRLGARRAGVTMLERLAMVPRPGSRLGYELRPVWSRAANRRWLVMPPDTINRLVRNG